MRRATGKAIAFRLSNSELAQRSRHLDECYTIISRCMDAAAKDEELGYKQAMAVLLRAFMHLRGYSGSAAGFSTWMFDPEWPKRFRERLDSL